MSASFNKSTFFGSEISRFKQRHYIFVVLKQNLYIRQVNSPVAIHIFHLGYLYLIGNFLWFFIKLLKKCNQLSTLHRRTVITGAYQFFQSKLIEIQCKIFEEIALVWVIAVAQHGLPSKMRPIMLQFLLNVRNLSIKLVFLLPFGRNLDSC